MISNTTPCDHEVRGVGHKSERIGVHIVTFEQDDYGAA